MKTLLCLVALWGGAVAEVSAPLGPYARPGIPLPLHSDEDTTVSVDGWTYRLRANEITYVAPMRAPCSVRDEKGNELLRLEAVPAGFMLAAWIGDGPEDLATRMKGLDDQGVVLVRLKPNKVVLWRAYDLFDRVYTLHLDVFLERWAVAGGSVATTGRSEDALRIGELVQAADPDGLIALAGPVRPLRVPRPRASRPDLYKALLPPEISPAALEAGRLVVLVAALAAAVLVLAGAFLRVERRFLLAGLGLVAVAGSVTGRIHTAAADDPLAVGRIEETFVVDLLERRRTYKVVTTLRAVPAPMPEPWETPVPFRSNPGPWWEEPGVPPNLGAGMTRIFLDEVVVPTTGPAEDETFPKKRVTNRPGEIPLIGGRRIVLQD